MTIRANIITTYRIENSNPPRLRNNPGNTGVTQSQRGADKTAKGAESAEVPENKKPQHHTRNHCRAKRKDGPDRGAAHPTSKVRRDPISSRRPEQAERDSVTLTRDTKPQQPAANLETYRPRAITEAAHARPPSSNEVKATNNTYAPPYGEQSQDARREEVEEAEVSHKTRDHEIESRSGAADGVEIIRKRAKESDDRSQRARNEKIADEIEARTAFAREAIVSADRRQAQQERMVRRDAVKEQAVRLAPPAADNRERIEKESESSDNSRQAPKAAAPTVIASSETEETNAPKEEDKSLTTFSPVPRWGYPQYVTSSVNPDDAHITWRLDSRMTEVSGSSSRDVSSLDYYSEAEDVPETENGAATARSEEFAQNLAAALSVATMDQPETGLKAPTGQDVIRQLQAEGVFGISATGRNLGVGDFARQKEFEYQLESKPFTAEAFLQETEKAIYATLGSERSTTVIRSLLRAAEAVNAYRNQMTKENVRTASMSVPGKAEPPNT